MRLVRDAKAASASLLEHATTRAETLARQLGVAKDAADELRRKEQRMQRYAAKPLRDRALPEQ